MQGTQLPRNASIYQLTSPTVLEDLKSYRHRRENLKSSSFYSKNVGTQFLRNVSIYQLTPPTVLEDLKSYRHRRENLKSSSFYSKNVGAQFLRNVSIHPPYHTKSAILKRDLCHRRWDVTHFTQALLLQMFIELPAKTCNGKGLRQILHEHFMLSLLARTCSSSKSHASPTASEFGHIPWTWTAGTCPYQVSRDSAGEVDRYMYF